ncbi:MAG: GTP-binding protein [Candidatus Lokiarchaeota archaeon]|nr:GTP-binding protein [Candidatus Lokiarchaeota archaeon]MBD3340267.1 GTP-binding protein [Candidatus Lokiarchaeota archaeon]
MVEPKSSKIDKYIRKNYMKIILAGDGAVGKTTMGKRLAGNLGTENNIKMTPGVEFHSLVIDSYEPIKIQLWDLGGQKQFRELQDDFFDKATIVILMFSVDRYHTFMNLESWLDLIPSNLLDKIYLIANKIDSDNRTVPRKKALQFANLHNMTYYEISAITGRGFEEFQEDLLNTIEYLYVVQTEND